jgi:hypothetical protein
MTMHPQWKCPQCQTEFGDMTDNYPIATKMCGAHNPADGGYVGGVPVYRKGDEEGPRNFMMFVTDQMAKGKQFGEDVMAFMREHSAKVEQPDMIGSAPQDTVTKP